MRWNRARFLLAIALLPALRVSARADDTISSAYAAILRGDIAAGQAVVARLREREQDRAEAARVQNWLDSYRKVVESRQEIRDKTFAWHVESAKKHLAEGKKLYLALVFAANATSYAADPKAYRAEPWVVELTERVKQRAAELAQAGKWRYALAHYSALLRIHEDDEELEELRDAAARHARLDMLYRDKKALERRIQNVDAELLYAAIRQIERNYYEEPDFRSMAEGALDNLAALCGSARMRTIHDGVANAALREFFLQKVEEQRQKVQKAERFTHRDLQRLFNDLKQVNNKSVELPEGLLVVEFLEGALQKLDEFTSMIWPADATEFDKIMMGGFEGVGIQLGTDELTGRLKVVTPLEASPALEAGIQPDDLIVEVDGVETKGWTTDDAIREIMGPAGTEVTLTMYRPSERRRIPFKLKRRRIVLRTVQGVERLPDRPGDGWNYLLDPDQGIAYIRLSGFHQDSQDELIKALAAARAQGMRGLILDLRHNPGGLLDVAVQTVSTFLESGAVVSTSGRREPPTQLTVDGDADYPDLPLVVLVNDGSASASEILAGTLQDHGRALVLGERTFGKGSVQKLLPLGNQARLKLTTAIYSLPSGRSPHKKVNADVWGVDPDLTVALTPKEVRKVLEHQRDANIIRRKDAAPAKAQPLSEEELKALADEKSDSGDEEPPLLSDEEIALLEADPVPVADIDPQLETALLQLRVKLAANLPWPRKLVAKTATETP